MNAKAQRTQDQSGLDKNSRVVRPADMPWEKARFPGCEVKTLLFDRESGIVTALFRMQPAPSCPTMSMC